MKVYALGWSTTARLKIVQLAHSHDQLTAYARPLDFTSHFLQGPWNFQFQIACCLRFYFFSVAVILTNTKYIFGRSMYSGHLDILFVLLEMLRPKQQQNTLQNKDRRLAYIRTTKDRAVLRSKDKTKTGRTFNVLPVSLLFHRNFVFSKRF